MSKCEIKSGLTFLLKAEVMRKLIVFALLTVFLTSNFFVTVPVNVNGQQEETSFSSVEYFSVNNDYFSKDYEWNYKGSRWTAQLSIPKSAYEAYKRVSVSERTRRGIGGYDFLITTADQTAIDIANKLHDAASEKGYEPYDEVSFILAFVQSLPYTVDSVTAGYDEYPRFPLETLVDDGGDCEDTSILFATILLILDYDVVFISPPEHLAVGVWGTELSRYHYTYNDRTYYYCETTSNGFRIGDIPSDYLDISVTIYSINPNNQYDPSQSSFLDSVDPFWKSYVLEFFAVLFIVGIILLLNSRKRHKANMVSYEPEDNTVSPQGKQQRQLTQF
jgi:hypothetical protein